MIETKLKQLTGIDQYESILNFDEPNIVRGLGRSYGDQAVLANGFTLKNRMSRIIAFDEDTGLLKAESGISIAEIIEVFINKGWFPPIVPGTKFVTLGGAIANDIHGKAHHVDGTFVNCVSEFTMITPEKGRLICSRSENEEIFYAAFGGLGLLGWIDTVTIQLKKIETSYFKTEAVKVSNLREMIDAFSEYDQNYRYSVAWFDPLAKGESLGKGVLSLGNIARLGEIDSGKQKYPLKLHSQKKLDLPMFLPNFALNKLSGQILNKIIEYSQANAPELTHYDKFFFPLDAIGQWNRGYGTRGFIQYQFVIPMNDEYKILKEAMNLISSSDCTPFLNVLKKMGEGSKYLSFPMEGFTLAIDFPISKKLPALIRKLDDLILSAGGRVYLGKDAFLGKEVFRKMYPQWEEWQNVKLQLDPEGKIQNETSKRLGLLSYL
ncbi:FAD-binding oxidoreductase [Mangrovivirga sp. M17]|uniref:FAD-binding oxidoreductase n=1 Tax=Mangrovivirga halotolerans TaxID=2993936 RepID=A0ABT3RKB3_9BACT|nr:FAD-binding oxidoreductase [Mangrovivirga halotolerans]MCX2742283.1 FAD-binding oxidoreductase [Mangrovivirga halotolerans]